MINKWVFIFYILALDSLVKTDIPLKWKQLIYAIKRSKVGYFQGVRQIAGKELLFCFIVVEQYILFSLCILESKKIKRS